MNSKVILSLGIANELVKRGNRVIEIKPSTKAKGNAAFVFEVTAKFTADLAEVAEARGIVIK
ncbi:hypothetical protein [Salimicrobium humidisoli]|uniref:Uncharacterized protein n=1 Tax=Salimicrobium humidisoli TaxID=2029857 RepID=A0ABX4HRD0_9BACI|nr:hypothetical protein [Salimicrobium humidisoli]PBB05744.1 hypothetical protein CKW00_07015 [Salimicrobium humidisoli]